MTNSLVCYYPVLVTEMHDFLSYVLADKKTIVTKNTVPDGIDMVYLPYDLGEHDKNPKTQEEAIALCDAA